MAERSPTDGPIEDMGHPHDATHSLLFRIGESAKPWLDFWTKLNNDWVFNLSGLLAYNFLMSLFPILLVLLAFVGFALGSVAPQALSEMQKLIAQLVPGGAELFAAVSRQLTNSARPLLIIGVVTAGFTGSRLFLVLENCFGIIFRVRGRQFLQQNLMAFGMLLLYLVLGPIIALASVIPSTIVGIVAPHMHDSVLPFLTSLLSVMVSGVSALVLIGGIYLVVPNRTNRLSAIWPGTVLASILLMLYVGLFPVYVNLFLHPGNYGAVAGFAVVILLFFYYLAFILLLGAEVNSWIAGQRPTRGDPPWIFQKMTSVRDATVAHDAETQ